jgi:spermidine synthase
VHVLTVEAFKTYFRHLKPGGILSVNITNRYLNLEPVMETASRTYGKKAVVFDYDAKSSEFLCTSSSWVLIVDKGSPVIDGLEGQRLITERAGFRTWTDDYSNMFGILR